MNPENLKGPVVDSYVFIDALKIITIDIVIAILGSIIIYFFVTKLLTKKNIEKIKINRIRTILIVIFLFLPIYPLFGHGGAGNSGISSFEILIIGIIKCII